MWPCIGIGDTQIQAGGTNTDTGLVGDNNIQTRTVSVEDILKVGENSEDKDF